ncbi:MAG TPA: KUP/HAK/KT family potassium transporter, partial [Phycisphaerales bacterium]|nr:KUP/HAK/KT family potassium transporter [Phycisphaerales bacterium]
DRSPIARVDGMAIYMTSSADGVPLALIHTLKHSKVLHERNVLLTLTSEQVPHVEDDRRIEQSTLGQGFHRVIARYGFMEERDVPALVKRIEIEGSPIDARHAIYVLSRETLIAGTRSGMWLWRSRVFSALARNALPATAFFGLPPNQVVEIGTQIEL